jgi:hypothetical protein
MYGINYNFVMGIRGIGYPEDEKSFQTDGELVTKKAGIEKIKKLWNEAAEFFFYGTFMDDLGLKISDHDIFAKVYLLRTKSLELLCGIPLLHFHHLLLALTSMILTFQD